MVPRAGVLVRDSAMVASSAVFATVASAPLSALSFPAVALTLFASESRPKACAKRAGDMSRGGIKASQTPKSSEKTRVSVP